MRVGVIGYRGMLGSAIMAQGADVIPIPLTQAEDSLAAVLSAARVEAVINCAGRLPRRPDGSPTPVTELYVSNTVLPATLAEACAGLGLPLLHVSTDCVYSPRLEYPRLHSPRRLADLPLGGVDPYGISKAVGDESVLKAGGCVVRTSFVGERHGLLRWLLDADGVVDGWTRAMWSGGTVDEVARALVGMVTHSPSGLIHLATARPISKAHLVELLVERLALPLQVTRVDVPEINRGLEPTIELPPIERQLVDDGCWDGLGLSAVPPRVAL